MTIATFAFPTYAPSSATFSPPLTPEQHEELHELVLEHLQDFDLCEAIEMAARSWGVEVTFDSFDLD